MFTVEDRAQLRAELIELAKRDPRVVAGAEVGSLTGAAGDQWSDLDLTFGLREGDDAREFLDSLELDLARRWDATRLFDLPSGSILYRVFLFPGNLQVDLSASPGGVVRTSPKFHMLFGEAVRDESPPPAEPRQLYGLCVHHALRARVSIERGRLWAAEFWIGELRHETMSLAALLRGLPPRYARGFHDLPADITDQAGASLVTAIARAELDRALAASIDLFVDVASELDDAPPLEGSLRELRAAP